MTWQEAWIVLVSVAVTGAGLASPAWVAAQEPKERATLKKDDGYVPSLAFSPDGKTLATGSSDNSVKLWDPATAKKLDTLKGHDETVFALAFSPDGKTLASAGRDWTVRLWDVLYFARFPHTRTPKTAEKMRGPSNNGPFGGFGKPAQKAANP